MINTTSAGARLAAFTLAGAVAGAGALALAPSNAADSSQGARHHHAKVRAERAFVRHIQHADWTTNNGKDHASIRGTVKALTADTVTIRSTDGTIQTWRVGTATKVRVVGDHHRGPDAFSEVKVGDRAAAVGSGSHAARHLIARTPTATTAG